MSNSDFYKKYNRENTKAIVIINKQHNLLDEQKKILEEKYGHEELGVVLA